MKHLKKYWILPVLVAGLLLGNAHADVSTWMNQAAQAASQGETKTAEKYYRKVLEAEPGHPHASVGLASLWNARGRTDEAKDLLEGLLAQHPRFQPAYFLLGMIYEKQGETAKARQAYETYVSIAPQNIPADPQIRIKLRKLGIY